MRFSSASSARETFKLRDKVKIREDSGHYGQHDDVGVITHNLGLNSWRVEWYDGYSNSYMSSDLELAEKPKKTRKQKIDYKPGTNIMDYVRKLIKKEKDKDRLKWLRTFERCILPQVVRDTIDEALTIVLNADKFDKWGLSEHFEKGITNSILIYGPPGTGKTMVSESIAAVLSKNLMVISAASVQSNIPGQTERNMTDSFKKATKEDCVILFDECDSLFYDRDSVGNILGAEINHFLTEIERFEGVAILTTNRLHRLDSALQRRIIAKVELGLPDRKAREEIWRTSIPKKMPCGEIDFKKLSKEKISGGDIKNAVILAARKGIAKNKKKVEMSDFEEALNNVLKAKEEYAKTRPRAYHSQSEDVSCEVVNNKNIDKVLR